MTPSRRKLLHRLLRKPIMVGYQTEEREDGRCNWYNDGTDTIYPTLAQAQQSAKAYYENSLFFDPQDRPQWRIVRLVKTVVAENPPRTRKRRRTKSI